MLRFFVIRFHAFPYYKKEAALCYTSRVYAPVIIYGLYRR